MRTRSCLLAVLALAPLIGSLRVGPLAPNPAPHRAAVTALAKERVKGPRTAALPPPDDLSDEVMLSIICKSMNILPGKRG